jgi:hypothetical protein
LAIYTESPANSRGLPQADRARPRIATPTQSHYNQLAQTSKALPKPGHTAERGHTVHTFLKALPPGQIGSSFSFTQFIPKKISWNRFTNIVLHILIAISFETNNCTDLQKQEK